jgi:membrane protein implicated in regulation of membrane protease activity
MAFLWWHWVVAGLILVAVELASAGGFYVIFFAIAALVVGILRLFGLAESLSQQLVLFAVISIASTLFFRSHAMRWLGLDRGAADVDSLVGEVGVTADEIAPGAVGRVELRGTTWSARNASSAPIPRGTRSVVVRVDRLMLMIQPEDSPR